MKDLSISRKVSLSLFGIALSLVLMTMGGIVFGHAARLEFTQQPSTSLVWTTLTPMTTPRSGAAIVIVDNYIYAIGGNTAYQSPTDSVEYAAINPNGTLGDWKQTQSLTVARGGTQGGPTAVEVSGYIYIIGGVTDDKGGGAPLSTVERANVNPDGSLGAWQVLTATLNTGRRGAASIVVGDYLYVVGGATGAWGLDTLDSVERSWVTPDATLGGWEVLTATMNTERGALGLVAYGGHLYAVGGYLDTDMDTITLNSVERAEIDPDGTLGTWILETPLTHSRAELSTAVVSNTLLVIGGWDFGRPAPPLEATKIGAGGSLGAWSVARPALVDRPGVSAAVHNQFIYVVGGHADSYPSPASTNAVERGALFENKVFLPLVLQL